MAPEIPVVELETPEIPAIPAAPTPEPKRKAGRPAGAKNKPAAVAPPIKARKSRAVSPSTSESDAPPPKLRPDKRRSRTRVIVLSSSEDEPPPPRVRVVRRPKPVLRYSSSSEGAELAAPTKPPPEPARAVVEPARTPVDFRTDLRASHQQHMDAKRATYDAYFRHLR